MRCGNESGPLGRPVLVGISPVLSAVIAIALLGEPVRAALVLGTLLVVAGGTLLAWERGGWRGLVSLGTGLGTLAAVLFSAGISLRLDWRPLRIAVLGLAAAMLLSGAVFVLTLPIA